MHIKDIDLNLLRLFDAVYRTRNVSRAADLLGLPAARIEAVYYLPEDWRSRVAQRAPYAVWLLEGPRTHLLGEPVSL